MKKFLFIVALLLISFCCKNDSDAASKEKEVATKQNEFAIIIHGGQEPF